MKWRFLAAAAALVVWLAQNGMAYHFLGPRWPSGSTTVMHLQLGSAGGTLSDGSADWNVVAEGALATWNSYLSQMSFRVQRDSTASLGLRNGVNNVAWSDDVYGEPFGDAIAVAPYLYTAGDNRIIEADVLFDRNQSWNSYRGNLRPGPNGTLLDLRRVALHEFGHTLGLDHPDEHGQSVAAIMNSRVSDTDALQADDIDGGRALYGAAAPPPPVRDTLPSNNRLTNGQSLVSGNSRYRLVYQGDGNLVLYDDVARSPLWATGTNAGAAGYVLMQGDGNLVVYDGAGAPRWTSNTAGNAGARLVVQGDGNVVIYRPDGVPVWDRHRPASPAPSPSPTPSPAPAPAPGTVPLAGVVSAQGGARLSGATVRVLDGPNSGRTAITNATGEYRFEGLTPGNANLGASASGHTEHRAGTFINGSNRLDFTLVPLGGGSVSETLTGTISAASTICAGSSTGNKPCTRHTFNVTSSGVATARLTWSNVQNDLDLELWRGSTKVTSSDGITAQEDISAAVTPGAYEWRVVYYAGSSAQSYSLAVTRPN